MTHEIAVIFILLCSTQRLLFVTAFGRRVRYGNVSLDSYWAQRSVYVKNISYLVFLIVYFCTEYIIVITWFSNGPERKTDKAVGRTFCPVAQCQSLGVTRGQTRLPYFVVVVLFFCLTVRFFFIQKWVKSEERLRDPSQLHLRLWCDRLRINFNYFTSDCSIMLTLCRYIV